MQIHPNGGFSATGVTVRQLVLRAYGLQDSRLVAGPGWMNSDRFDIEARAEGDVTPDRFSSMLRSLLAERFNFGAHDETRDIPIYALVLSRSDGRLGPKLRRSEVDCDAVAEAAIARGGAPPRATPGEPPACSVGFSGRGQMAARSKPLPALLTFFSQVTARTVVDRTGLTGIFDVDLTWTPDAAQPDADGPSIFTAVQEQLGLKLEPLKTPVMVLVVDRVESPSEN